MKIIVTTKKIKVVTTILAISLSAGLITSFYFIYAADVPSIDINNTGHITSIGISSFNSKLPNIRRYKGININKTVNTKISVVPEAKSKVTQGNSLIKTTMQENNIAHFNVPPSITVHVNKSLNKTITVSEIINNGKISTKQNLNTTVIKTQTNITQTVNNSLLTTTTESLIVTQEAGSPVINNKAQTNVTEILNEIKENKYNIRTGNKRKPEHKNYSAEEVKRKIEFLDNSFTFEKFLIDPYSTILSLKRNYIFSVNTLPKSIQIYLNHRNSESQNIFQKAWHSVCSANLHGDRYDINNLKEVFITWVNTMKAKITEGENVIKPNKKPFLKSLVCGIVGDFCQEQIFKECIEHEAIDIKCNITQSKAVEMVENINKNGSATLVAV